jgi:hypothetical protein
MRLIVSKLAIEGLGDPMMRPADKRSARGIGKVFVLLGGAGVAVVIMPSKRGWLMTEISSSNFEAYY